MEHMSAESSQLALASLTLGNTVSLAAEGGELGDCLQERGVGVDRVLVGEPFVEFRLWEHCLDSLNIRLEQVVTWVTDGCPGGLDALCEGIAGSKDNTVDHFDADACVRQVMIVGPVCVCLDLSVGKASDCRQGHNTGPVSLVFLSHSV